LNGMIFSRPSRLCYSVASVRCL